MRRGARSPGRGRRVSLRGAKTALGTFDGETIDGTPATFTYARSSESGWTTIVGIPRSALQAQFHRDLGIIAAIALALTVALATASLMAREISNGIRSLISPALHLGTGRPVASAHTSLRETDAVADAVRSSNGFAVAKRGADLRAPLQQMRKERQPARRHNRFALPLDSSLEADFPGFQTAVMRRAEKNDRPIVELVRVVDVERALDVNPLDDVIGVIDLGWFADVLPDFVLGLLLDARLEIAAAHELRACAQHERCD